MTLALWLPFLLILLPANITTMVMYALSERGTHFRRNLLERDEYSAIGMH